MDIDDLYMLVLQLFGADGLTVSCGWVDTGLRTYSPPGVNLSAPGGVRVGAGRAFRRPYTQECHEVETVLKFRCVSFASGNKL